MGRSYGRHFSSNVIRQRPSQPTAQAPDEGFGGFSGISGNGIHGRLQTQDPEELRLRHEELLRNKKAKESIREKMKMKGYQKA